MNATKPVRKDIFGQTESKAANAFKLNETFQSYHLRLIRGVWVLTTWNRLSTHSRKAWKKYPSYAALGRGRKIICGIGNRQETINAAIRR